MEGVDVESGSYELTRICVNFRHYWSLSSAVMWFDLSILSQFSCSHIWIWDKACNIEQRLFEGESLYFFIELVVSLKTLIVLSLSRCLCVCLRACVRAVSIHRYHDVVVYASGETPENPLLCLHLTVQNYNCCCLTLQPCRNPVVT